MAIDPRTLPDYIPGGFYDDNGNLIAFYGPYGGAPSGGPGVGYSAVGAPNSGGGAGYVGSGYGYTPAGPPVASIGGFGDRGQGINADASMYRGGDFQGGGSDAFAGTDFAGGGGGGGIDPLTGEQTVYRGGGIGSDAGATGGRYVEGIGEVARSWNYDPLNEGNWYTDLGLPIGANNYNDQQQPQQNFADMWGNSGGRYPSTQVPTYSGGGIGSDAARVPGQDSGMLSEWYRGGGIGSDAARTGDRPWGDPRWWDGGIGSDAGATRGRIAEILSGGGGPTWNGEPLQPYYNQPYNQAYPIGSGGQMGDFPSMQWPPGLAGENVFVGSPGVDRFYEQPFNAPPSPGGA